jgi:hypothetical protein
MVGSLAILLPDDALAAKRVVEKTSTKEKVAYDKILDTLMIVLLSNLLIRHCFYIIEL